jgi:hypothetical protein
MFGTPRALCYYNPWWGLVLWILLLALLGDLTEMRISEDYRFTHYAIPTTGTVMGKHITTSHHRRGGTSHSYHLSVGYQVGADGDSDDLSVTYDTYSAFQPGGAIPLMYLPTDPDMVRVNLQVEEDSIHRGTFVLEFITGVVLVGGGVIIGLLFRNNAIYRRVLDGGLVVEGRVRAVNFDYVGKARVQKFYLRIEYREAGGQLICGQSQYLTPAQEGRWQEGDAIEVRYDRMKPKCFVVDLDRAPRRGI